LFEPPLQHAHRHMPFHVQRLALLFRGETLDLDRFQEIPIFTRPQAQANANALAARNLPPHVGPVETHETSGSTGRPFVHRPNQLPTIAGLSLTDRLLR
jgi:phenylacetate-coenzyme A ligase PaaK-like adenylate-forming protein